MKTIELNNPTSHTIQYSVRLEGSSDFSIAQYNLTLESKGKAGSKARFPVRFKSRMSRPVEARLIFSSSAGSGSAGGSGSGSASDAEATAAAATLVFALKSNVSARQALNTHRAAARCYELANVVVPVTNIFDHDCNFAVQLLIDRQRPAEGKRKRQESAKQRGEPIPPGSSPPRRRKQLPGSPAQSGAGASEAGSAAETKADQQQQQQAGSDGKAELRRHASLESTKSTSTGGGSAASLTGGGASGTAAVADAIPPTFFCRLDKVKIKTGETVQFPLQFLAWRAGEYRAQLLFVDEAAGEFMHEIVATAGNPLPFDAVKWTQQSESLLPLHFASC